MTPDGILHDGSGQFVPFAPAPTALSEAPATPKTTPSAERGRAIAYTPILDAGNRPVVIEEFTATWCPYCYGAGMALDIIQKELTTRKNVLVIAHHIWSDGFDTPYGNTRSSYYGIGYIPTLWFGGHTSTRDNSTVGEGDSAVDGVVESYIQKINAEITRTASNQPFRCALTGTLARVDTTLTLHVQSDVGYPHSVIARFVVTEDNVPVNASNGQTELNAVVKTALEKTIDLSQPGAHELTVQHTGYISCASESDLRVVVFLQDTQTREIVGAVGEIVQPVLSAGPSWELYK